VAASYPNERPWDGESSPVKPAFRLFHHDQDGILDASCVAKVRAQLVARGYPETAPFTLSGASRSIDAHYWLDDYNEPILDFFQSRLR
jgi:hypothetical protein